MDVSKLKVVDRAAIHLKDAAGDPLYEGDKPVRVVVYGPGSQVYSTVETRQTNRALKRMQENDGKATAASAEERRRETAEDLTAVTAAFEHLACGDLQGPDLFMAVYNDPELGFIARQVSKFLTDWGNFKPGSAGI